MNIFRNINFIVKLLVFALLFFAEIASAQKSILQISRSDDNNEWTKYPPGTEFELRDENNTIVFSHKNEVGEFKIDGTYKIEIRPTYNDETEAFVLTSGKVELLEPHYKKLNYGYYGYDREKFANGLNMARSFEKSVENPKEYNALFKFSNGITAKYTDGKMTATLEDKPLEIEGHYLIYSDLGLIKLSYNAKNKETWWVFEPA